MNGNLLGYEAWKCYFKQKRVECCPLLGSATGNAHCDSDFGGWRAALQLDLFPCSHLSVISRRAKLSLADQLRRACETNRVSFCAPSSDEPGSTTSRIPLVWFLALQPLHHPHFEVLEHDGAP